MDRYEQAHHDLCRRIAIRELNAGRIQNAARMIERMDQIKYGRPPWEKRHCCADHR